MNETIAISIETRIDKMLTPLLDEALSDYARVYNRAKWSYISRKNNKSSVPKSRFMQEFGLSSRQFNAIKGDVDGLFQSQHSNYVNYILTAEQKIANSRERIQQIIADPLLHSAYKDDANRRQGLWNEYRGCLRRIDRLTGQVAKWNKLISEKKISACNGSKALFRKQHELHANGYRNHKQWYQDFTLARSSEFFSKGSKDETSGNLSCMLSQEKDGYTLKLKVPPVLESKYGKHIAINNLNFKYKASVIEDAIASNQLRAEHKKNLDSEFLKARHQENVQAMRQRHLDILTRMENRGDHPDKVNDARQSYKVALDRFASPSANNLLTDFGQALSYRFKRDRKGWRIIVSVKQDTEVKLSTDISNGAIGVDLNEHHLSITEINAHGGKVSAIDLPFRTVDYGMSSAQVKTSIGESVKQLVQRAKETGKPIVIESLDFKSAKSKLKAGKEKAYNRTVSSLVTDKFLNILKLRCLENGIELIKVNAAYTSFIGRMKYAAEFNHNIHQAAAMVIARRGAGFQDRRLPKQVLLIIRRSYQCFTVPEDTVGNDAFSYLRRVKAAYDKWFKETLAELREGSKPPRKFCEELPF